MTASALRNVVRKSVLGIAAAVALAGTSPLRAAHALPDTKPASAWQANSDSPMAWLPNASGWQQLYRTSDQDNSTPSLLVDSSNNPVREAGPYITPSTSSPPPGCSANDSSGPYDMGQSGEPCIKVLYHQFSYYSVESQHILSLQSGDTIDAHANINVSSPDCTYSGTGWYHDAAWGQLIFASSPVATSGVAITSPNGGSLDMRGCQHHFGLAARGTHTTTASDQVLSWAQAGTLYVNMVVSTWSDDAAGTTTNPYTMSVDAPWGQLAAQVFRSASGGQQLMAVDSMAGAVSRNISTTLPATPWPSNMVPIWQATLNNLRAGQIIQAHADVTFSYGTTSCIPNITTQILLTQYPIDVTTTGASTLTHDQYENTQQTMYLSAQEGTNLTQDEQRQVVTRFGALQIPTTVSNLTGTWYVSLLAATTGCSVTVHGTESNASALRFRPANPGEAGWQESATETTTALAGGITVGTNTWGPQSNLYETGWIFGGAPGEIVDAAGEAQAGSPNCTIEVASYLKYDVYRSFDGSEIGPPEVRVDAPTTAQLPVIDNATGAVPGDGSGGYWFKVKMTVDGHADTGCTPSNPWPVTTPNGSLSVETYWPTSVMQMPWEVGGRMVTGLNADGRLEVFTLGSDNAVWHEWQNSVGSGTGSGWASLGGCLQGVPTVGRNSDGRLQIFARGCDDQIWQNWQVCAGCSWSGWYPMGGSATSDPVVATNPSNGLEVFVRGTDGAVWHDWACACSGGWSGFWSLGGYINGNPSVGKNANGDLEIFARGGDNAVWHIWQCGCSTGWSGWCSLGGNLTSDIAVGANGDGRLEIFANGGTGMWHNWQNCLGCGWSGWYSLGGDVTSGPSVALNPHGRLEIFANGADGAVWHLWQCSCGSGWSSWSSLGDAVDSVAPAVARNSSGLLEVYSRGWGIAATIKQTDPDSWGPWMAM